MKKKKNKKIYWILVFILIILLLSLTYFLLLNFEVFEKISRKEVIFEIKDECSLIMNNIVYQIKDEDICRMMCFNECSIRELTFQKSDFSPVENSCNRCECYCK
jgi:hypothetical protein